jgi:hypothetical protein
MLSHFETQDTDIENMMDRLYSPSFNFSILPISEQNKEIEMAKKSHNFESLNYLHTGENFNKVSDYILKTNNNLKNKPSYDYTFFKTNDAYLFTLNTTVGVKVVTKKDNKIPKKFEESLDKLELDFVKVVDQEFFESHYAAQLLMKDWISNQENLIERLYKNEFRHNKFANLSIFKMKSPNKYSLLEYLAEEELELVYLLKEQKIDNKQFTGFYDKEKIHIKYLIVKDRITSKGITFPYFIGIGNNYPFTRALQKKNHGDNRFYRESLDEVKMEYTLQDYERKNGLWILRTESLNTKNSIKYLEQNLKRDTKTRFKELIKNSQKNYPEFFRQVNNIDKLYEQFSIKKGIKTSEETKQLNNTLMLNPRVRLRAAAVVAYSYLENLRF